VLFFELFAPFMAVLSVIVAVRLYLKERQARHDPAERLHAAPVKREPTADDQGPERVRRPSMLP
jgi:hypothetical protein